MSAWGWGTAVHTHDSVTGVCVGVEGNAVFLPSLISLGSYNQVCPVFIKKGRLQLRPFEKPYKEATTLHQRGLGRGAGVECGKADAYLGSWHSGEHSNTSLHPTNHRNGRRTASVQAEKGKGFPKAN